MVALFLLVAVLTHLSATATPDAKGADAPADRFAAGRALAHLEFIARAPRPVGSAHHDAVRDHVRGTLAGLGLAVEVQQSVVGRPWGRGRLVVGKVVNVVARVPGRRPRGTVLLAVHYDSVASGPGASDDGAAVAALLEAARVFAADPPENDLVLLFSDGEELGLYGARAFAEEHPWGGEVDVAVNFEARGTRGPALLFETSEVNQALIEAYAALERPTGSTLANEVYARLPHDTDLTVFARRGVPSMNFGFIEAATPYHTAVDDLAHLDPRSLQHHGETMVALGRDLGGRDLEAPWTPGRTVFFPLPGAVARYPLSAAPWLAALTLVATLAAVGVGVRRGRLRAGKLVTAAPLQVLLILLTSGLGLAGWWGLHGAFVQVRDQLLGAVWSGGYAMACLGALAVALQAAASARLRQAFALEEQIAGALLAWNGVNGVLIAFLPGAAYLVTWPVLAAAVAQGVLWWRPFASDRASTSGLLALTAVPTAIMVAPTIVGAWVATQLPGAALTLLLVALACGLTLPHLDHLSPGRPWRLPAAALAVAAALAIATLLTMPYDDDAPQPSSLSYLLDADTGTARWLSSDEAPNAWSAPALGAATLAGDLTAYHPELIAPLLVAEAPRMDLPAPELQATSAEGRAVTGRLVSHRADALELTVLLAHPDQLEQLVLGGYEVPPTMLASPAPLAVTFWNPGAELSFASITTTDAPLDARLTSLAFDVPPPFDARPRAVVCRPFWPRLSCVTLVSAALRTSAH